MQITTTVSYTHLTENKDLIELLEIEKTLVYFMTSLKANDVVLEKLSKGIILPLYEGCLLYTSICTYFHDFKH